MHNLFSHDCHKYISLNDQCTRFLPLIGGLGALFTIQHSGRISHSCTFLSYWRQLAPCILVMKPMTDLYLLCQKNSAAITKSKNMPDETKSLVRLTRITNDHTCIYTFFTAITGYSSCTRSHYLGVRRAGLLQGCV